MRRLKHPQEAKTQTEVPDGGSVVVPIGATLADRFVVPTSAPEHPEGSATIVYRIFFI